MESKISIIIPTMNRPESLSRTLSYLAACAPKRHQLIVVDQTADEGMRQQNVEIINIQTSHFESISYLYQEVPGLTKARNSGIKAAANEILLFMDDDVDVYPDTLKNLSELFENTRLSMVGGLNEYDLNDVPSHLSVLFGMASYAKRNMGHITRACYSRFPIKCSEQTLSEWAMGFFFAVRKSLVKKLNILFDENLKSYAYAEDLDFTYRYHLKSLGCGFITIMSNRLVVRHNVSKEYRIPSRRHVFMTVCHRYYISHKCGLPNYELWNLWSNLGLFVLKCLKREHPMDVVKAQLYYYHNRKVIITGKLLFDNI